jgi:hypothetical protein
MEPQAKGLSSATRYSKESLITRIKKILPIKSIDHDWILEKIQLDGAKLK